MPDSAMIESRLRLRRRVDPAIEDAIRSYRDAPPSDGPATKAERRRKRAEVRRKAAAKAAGPDPLADLVAIVKHRIREAGETLRRMRSPRELSQLRNFATLWPDFVRERVTDYPDPATRIHLTATPAQISRLDEVLDWIMWLDSNERRLVGAYMCRVRREKIARLFGCSRHTVLRRYDAAAREIAFQLLAARCGD